MNIQRPNALRVGAVQCPIYPLSPRENRELIESWVLRYARELDLIVFPETITTGFSPEAGNHIEPIDGETVQLLQSLADTYNIGIAGSLLIEWEGIASNAFFLFQPHQAPQWQGKRHLFILGGESEVIAPAHKRNILNFRGWRILPLVCYDLRFPVWCRNVGCEYDMIIAVANWPEGRAEVWRTLLRARAMENLAYCIGSNRIGTDLYKLNYSGDSMVISPRGKILGELPAYEEGIVIAQIAYTEVERLREKFPVWKDADKFEIEDVAPLLQRLEPPQ